MARTTEISIKAHEILASNKSDDLKLFEIFELYKDDIQKENTALFYALLGWKYNHFTELQKEQNRR